MKQQTLHLLDIDEDIFITRYGPKPNHLDLSAGFDWGNGHAYPHSSGAVRCKDGALRGRPA